MNAAINSLPLVSVLLGVFFLVRGLMNLNKIHILELPLIALLNFALMLAGVAMICAPSQGEPETLLAAFVALGVFASCTLIGRRPGDKVLDRGPSDSRKLGGGGVAT